MKGPRRWTIESGVLAALVVTALLAGLFALSGCVAGTMTLGTTRSLQQSGLLAQILPQFEKKYNVKVTVVAKDTAAEVLKLGEEGKRVPSGVRCFRRIAHFDHSKALLQIERLKKALVESNDEITLLASHDPTRQTD